MKKKFDVQFKCEIQLDNFKKAEMKSHLEKALPGLLVSTLVKKGDIIQISSNLQNLLFGTFRNQVKGAPLQTESSLLEELEKLKKENEELQKKIQDTVELPGQILKLQNEIGELTKERSDNQSKLAELDPLSNQYQLENN